MFYKIIALLIIAIIFVNGNKEIEHFHTLFTPHYVTKYDREKKKDKWWSTNWVRQEITISFPENFSQRLKARILLDVGNHSRILSLKQVSEDGMLSISDTIFPNGLFISKLADKYLFAITRYCDNVIDFRDIKCRKVGVQSQYKHIWEKFLELFKIDVNVIMVNNDDPIDQLKHNRMDVFLYCDYFPNTLISKVLLDDNLTLVKFPNPNKETPKDQLCGFILRNIEINELPHQSVPYNPYPVRLYNPYNMFGNNFRYRTYKFNEVLVSNKSSIDPIVGYDIAKIIFERLSMRNIDRLVPIGGQRMEIDQGALKFIEEVTQTKNLYTEHSPPGDETHTERTRYTDPL